MHRFLHCINGICIDYRGMLRASVPMFERYTDFEKRVLAEIFSPKFAEENIRNVGLLRSLNYKFRGWWANRWKHCIIYCEGLASTFFVQLDSHLVAPKSLRT